MSISWLAKDPQETDLRRHDFAAMLNPGESATSYTATRLMGSIVVDSPTFPYVPAQAWVDFKLSGGADGETDIFDVLITTNLGNLLAETLIIQVINSVPVVAATGYYVALPTSFVARYPEFRNVEVALLQAYYDEAALFLGNTDLSIVCDVQQRQVLLNMLTAHIASLAGAGGTGVPSGIVGRIKSAREGTVGVDYADYLKSEDAMTAWLTLTPYGATFLAATAQYRTFQYITGPSRNFEPWGGLDWNAQWGGLPWPL